MFPIQNIRNFMPLAGKNKLIEKTIKQSSIETHNFLGESGIKVSKLCLGTMTFGNIDKTFGERPGQLSENEAHRILDRFVDLGGNFIDTSSFYPFFGNTVGESENIVGSWLVRQDRKKLVVASTVGLPTDLRNPNAIGASRTNLVTTLEQSLRRLKTSYVDLLSIGGWDETTNIGDVMRTLNDFVRDGKVRHVGCCDIKAWQLQLCLDYAKVFNMEKYMTISCEYNLLSRGADLEIVDVCRLNNVGLLPYSPLKGGYLTNKIKPSMSINKLPEDTRIAAASKDCKNIAAFAVPFEEMKNNELYKQVFNSCKDIAKKHKKTVAQVALRYLLHKDFVCSVVIGVNSVHQLEENMGCLSFSLDQEDVEELDLVSLPPLPAPYNVDAFMKLTRSRMQLQNNLTTSTSKDFVVVSPPIQTLIIPNLISIPPNIVSGMGDLKLDEEEKRWVVPTLCERETQRQRRGSPRRSPRRSPKSSPKSSPECSPERSPKQSPERSNRRERSRDRTIGSTLGSIAHTIGSSLTGAMSAGMSTSSMDRRSH